MVRLGKKSKLWGSEASKILRPLSFANDSDSARFGGKVSQICQRNRRVCKVGCVSGGIRYVFYEGGGVEEENFDSKRAESSSN